MELKVREKCLEIVKYFESFVQGGISFEEDVLIQYENSCLEIKSGQSKQPPRNCFIHRPCGV